MKLSCILIYVSAACSSKDRQTFNAALIKVFKEEYDRVNVTPPPSPGSALFLVFKSRESKTIYWFFLPFLPFHYTFVEFPSLSVIMFVMKFIHFHIDVLVPMNLLHSFYLFIFQLAIVCPSCNVCHIPCYCHSFFFLLFYP